MCVATNRFNFSYFYFLFFFLVWIASSYMWWISVAVRDQTTLKCTLCGWQWSAAATAVVTRYSSCLCFTSNLVALFQFGITTEEKNGLNSLHHSLRALLQKLKCIFDAVYAKMECSAVSIETYVLYMCQCSLWRHIVIERLQLEIRPLCDVTFVAPHHLVRIHAIAHSTKVLPFNWKCDCNC